MVQDFQALRAQAESEGLFRARPVFFCLQLGHVLLLEALSWLILWVWGTRWTLTLLCSVILATAQVTGSAVADATFWSGIFCTKVNKAPLSRLLLQSQAGWLQHDFGHLSVFKKSAWNHILHKFVIGHLKVSLLTLILV